MVFHLLVLGRGCTEQGATGLVQVRALQVETLVNQEIFLFGTESDGDLLLSDAEETHKAVGGLLESLNGTEKRSLLVQGFAGVATECGRDAKRCAVAVALDEGRRGRIPGGIAAGFESRAEAAARERRCVRFADDQVLAAEGHDGLAVFGFQEGVVLFGGRTGEGLEPVRKVGGAAVDGPFFYGMCHFVRDARVKRCALVDGGEKLLADVLGQVGAHGLCVKDILSVKVEACGGGRHIFACVFARDFLDGF